MKNTLLLFGMVGLTAVMLSSFVLVQNGDEMQGPKRTRHIIMTKIENGKKMELDTVLTGDDVFVWMGDTINPIKHFGKFDRPEFDKMHPGDVRRDRRPGNEKMIVRHGGQNDRELMIQEMDLDDDMEFFNEDNDSVGKRMVVRSRMRDGVDDHMIFMDGDREMLVPPPPPVQSMPPVPNMKVMKMQRSGKTIDLNDPNIISYKKKKMSGNREKIEIIRKKSGHAENTTFNFQFDDDLMVPEPPEVPVFKGELEGDSLQMQINREEETIDGKKGKKIEVEIQSKENK
jgi:hypothetical protein